MSGNTSFKHTAAELFGSPSISAIVDLPCHLGRLCTRVPGAVLNINKIIDKHTLLPYYMSFLSERQVDILRTAMTVGAGYSIHALLGNRNTLIKNPAWLRYCSECLELQESKSGVCYWRRVHQLPGVVLCPDHRVVLKDSKVEFSRLNNERMYEVLRRSPSDQDTKVPVLSENVLSHLAFIAEQSSWLVGEGMPLSRDKQIQEFYKDALAARGLLTLQGRVHMVEFANQFNAFYGKELLQFLGSWVDTTHRGNWLYSALRPSRGSCHPLRHILLSRFLGTSLQELLNPALARRPGLFGPGPWPCLNKICVNYRQNVIEHYSITRNKKTKTKIGTFQCACGYSYTRSEERSGEEYRFQGRVKDVGALWMGEFGRLRDSGCSLRSMARRLGISTTVIQRLLGRRSIT